MEDIQDGILVSGAVVDGVMDAHMVIKRLRVGRGCIGIFENISCQISCGEYIAPTGGRRKL